MSVFDKAVGYQLSQHQLDKKLRNAERENQRINDYYHKALTDREIEIKQLRNKINQFLVSQAKNKKAYYQLKQDYANYREESAKLVTAEYDKVYKAYELEKKKNLLLEEKVRVLEETLKHLKSE